MKKHPASSKQFADLKKNLKAREAQSFKDVPGAPVDDQGAPLTNLQTSEFNHRGGEVMYKGTGINDAPRLVSTYGGQVADWEKVKSTSSAGLDLHAYRNAKTGQVVEPKTKRLDESKHADAPNNLPRTAGSDRLPTPNTPANMDQHTPPKNQPDRLAEMQKQGAEMTRSAAREKARADKAQAAKERLAGMQKQGAELTGSAAREKIRAEKAQAAKDRLAEMSKQGQEMTKPKDRLTAMKEQGSELTGSEARTQERRDKKIEQFKENFR